MEVWGFGSPSNRCELASWLGERGKFWRAPAWRRRFLDQPPWGEACPCPLPRIPSLLPPQSSATQASEEREISIAEVLSTLQEEIPDNPSNTMDFLDTPSISTSPSPTLVAIQERLESPFLLEAQSSVEEPWKVPQERKKAIPMEPSPTSRYEPRVAQKETQEVAHGAGGPRYLVETTRGGASGWGGARSLGHAELGCFPANVL